VRLPSDQMSGLLSFLPPKDKEKLIRWALRTHASAAESDEGLSELNVRTRASAVESDYEGLSELNEYL
jgi:hypothetical protein